MTSRYRTAQIIIWILLLIIIFVAALPTPDAIDIVAIMLVAIQAGLTTLAEEEKRAEEQQEKENQKRALISKTVSFLQSMQTDLKNDGMIDDSSLEKLRRGEPYDLLSKEVYAAVLACIPLIREYNKHRKGRKRLAASPSSAGLSVLGEVGLMVEGKRDTAIASIINAISILEKEE